MSHKRGTVYNLLNGVKSYAKNRSNSVAKLRPWNMININYIAYILCHKAGRMIKNGHHLVKYMEGSGHDLLLGTIPAFSWRD
jgi:hypothetical protein